MQLQTFALSDVGRVRTTNQDAFRCDPEAGLFVVCDGVSGHAAGDVAAQHTAESLAAALNGAGGLIEEVAANRADTGRLAELLRITIERASGELHAMGKEDLSRRGMGCTCTALVVAGARAVMAHVGDSRLYLLRQGQLTLVSSDHTYLAEALQYGLLSIEEAATSPYAHVITRAVGTQPTVIVDLVPFDLAAGDTLLLCSDGLHRYFQDAAELAKLMATESLEEAIQTFMRIGNERGGTDNMTAVGVRIPESAGARPTLLNGVSALQHVELFRDLELGEVLRLFQAFEPRTLAAGEVFVTEGEQSDAFFVLVSGSVELYRRGVLVATMPQGTHFGEISLLANRPRTATVRAVEACQVLMARRDTLYPLLAHEPGLAAKFFWKLAQILSLRLDEMYTAQPAQLLPAPTQSPGPPAWKKTRLFGLPKVPADE